MCLQCVAQCGFAGQADAFISQHGHDACGRHSGKARLVGHGQQVGTFSFTQGKAWHRAYRLGPTVATDETSGGLPALEGAQISQTRSECHVEFLVTKVSD